jgi:UDP-glucuronate 4-epimerase
MKVLVTGAAGFIGFHLVKKLLESKFKVTGIDNLNNYYSVKLKYDRLLECGIETSRIQNNTAVNSSKYEKYTFFKMDLIDFLNLKELFREGEFDIIINLAAQAGVRNSIEDPHTYIQSNVVGFLNILELCKLYPPSKLLYASSSSVYGLNVNQPFTVTDKTDQPASMYAVTKKTNELMAHTYSHLYNFETIGLRFFTVYGPWGRPDMAPFLFADAIVNNGILKVFNHGAMERDFTYIDDIVNGISKIVSISSGEKYQLFNIGNGKPVNLMYFIKCLEEKFGKQASKIMMDMQSGDVPKTWAETKELEEIVGYKSLTEIEVGVDKFVSWYLKYYAK